MIDPVEIVAVRSSGMFYPSFEQRVQRICNVNEWLCLMISFDDVSWVGRERYATSGGLIIWDYTVRFSVPASEADSALEQMKAYLNLLEGVKRE